MTTRGMNGLTALALVLLLAAVSFTAPRWAVVFRRPLQLSGEEPPPQESQAQPSASPSAEARGTINVKLFFEAKEGGGLVLEERVVPFSSDLAVQVRTLVEELAKGPTSDLGPTLATDTKVLEVFVTARGVAYVDLSKEAGRLAASGSEAEQATVYSLVDSITSSFPSISRVQILIDNEPAATLTGHVDLSRPLPPDMTLLAAQALVPVQGVNGEAGSPKPAPSGAPPS